MNQTKPNSQNFLNGSHCALSIIPIFYLDLEALNVFGLYLYFQPQLLNNIILLLAHCMLTIQFLYSSDIEMLHLLNIPESPTCCGHLGLSGLSWKAKYSCFTALPFAFLITSGSTFPLG